MNCAKLILFSLTSVSALSIRDVNAWTPGQEVKTQSGLVKGHVATWPAGSGISEYLGIPYAKVPTGSLRFAPPVLNKSNATFVADKYVSIQRFLSRIEKLKLIVKK
jgi:hypothetical protein